MLWMAASLQKIPLDSNLRTWYSTLVVSSVFTPLPAVELNYIDPALMLAPSLNLGQTLMLRLRYYSIEVQGPSLWSLSDCLRGKSIICKEWHVSNISMEACLWFVWCFWGKNVISGKNVSHYCHFLFHENCIFLSFLFMLASSSNLHPFLSNFSPSLKHLLSWLDLRGNSSTPLSFFFPCLDLVGFNKVLCSFCSWVLFMAFEGSKTLISIVWVVLVWNESFIASICISFIFCVSDLNSLMRGFVVWFMTPFNVPLVEFLCKWKIMWYCLCW